MELGQYNGQFVNYLEQNKVDERRNRMLMNMVRSATRKLTCQNGLG